MTYSHDRVCLTKVFTCFNTMTNVKRNDNVIKIEAQTQVNNEQ